MGEWAPDWMIEYQWYIMGAVALLLLCVICKIVSCCCCRRKEKYDPGRGVAKERRESEMVDFSDAENDDDDDDDERPRPRRKWGSTNWGGGGGMKSKNSKPSPPKTKGSKEKKKKKKKRPKRPKREGYNLVDAGDAHSEEDDSDCAVWVDPLQMQLGRHESNGNDRYPKKAEIRAKKQLEMEVGSAASGLFEVIPDGGKKAVRFADQVGTRQPKPKPILKYPKE